MISCWWLVLTIVCSLWQVCNFTWFGGRSPAVLIDGVKNFEITDNDLYSAWSGPPFLAYQTVDLSMIMLCLLFSGSALATATSLRTPPTV